MKLELFFNNRLFVCFVIASDLEPEPAPESQEPSWWEQFVSEEQFNDMRISVKLQLLFGILKECEQIGDKL